MQRAAARPRRGGRCRCCRTGCTGAASSLLVGPGTTAATRCGPVPRLAGAGRGVDAVLPCGPRRTRRDWPRWSRPAAGCVAGGVGLRRTAAAVRWPEADVVVDGLLGIGGRPGLPGAGGSAGGGRPRRRGGRRRRPAQRRRPGHRRDRPVDDVCADVTVTFGVAKPVPCCPATEPAGGLVAVVDIGLDLAGPDPAVRAARAATTSRALLAGARARTTTSTPAACSASSPAGDVHRCRGARCTAAPSRPAPAWCATSDPGRRPTWCAPAGPRSCPAPVGCRPGWSGRGSTRRRRGHGREQRRRGPSRPWPRASRPSSTPGPRPARTARPAGRRPTLLTPHAGELARLLTRLDRPRSSAPTSRRRPLHHARRRPS